MISVKKYPFIKQASSKDCAVACVWMIVRYYNGSISTFKLEEMLKTTRKGTDAYHVVETLKKIGFNAYGIKLDEIKKSKIPFIANVIIDNMYKHYIVVYEVNSKYLLVADPASGIKKISFNDFYNIWTGVNINMYPNGIIVNEKSKSYDVLKIIKFNKVQLLIIGLLSLVITFLAILTSFFFKYLIDNIGSNLKIVIFIFLLLFIIKDIINYYRGKLLIKYTYNTDKHLTLKSFEQIIKLPYYYYHNHTTGEIISKINDLSTIRDVVGKIILTIFIDLPLTIFSGLLLFMINKVLFLLVFIILVLYIIIIFIYYKKINNGIYESLYKKASINSFMFESIRGFETIKGLNIEKKIIYSFNKKYKDYISSNINLDYIINRQALFKYITNDLGNAFIIIIGISLVMNGYLSLSTLITYNILVSFFLEPVKNIIDLDFEAKEAYQSLLRINDLIEYKRENICKNLVGNIKFINVSFSIDDVNFILKNINLKIKKGNKVLIGGYSGSGKSTLLKLIKGYYSNYSGNVLIGNKEVSRAHSVVYISQKEVLFTGTINYNLTLKGNDNLEVIKRICNIDDITSGNELEDNMLLEEDGFNISGGQKQRVVLARALHDFDILLIDEGFSGIDVNLERIILKRLFDSYKDKTIIIVSHRIDNLDLFDQYIKIDKGKVIIDSSKPRKEK